SPEALMKAPRGELEQVLAVMNRERQEAKDGGGKPTPGQLAENNADYELATTGHDRTAAEHDPLAGDADGTGGAHGEVREGEHVESGAPGGQAGFVELAEANQPHFAVDNIKLNWLPKHELALDLAKQAWELRHPGESAAARSAGDAPSAREGTNPDAGAGAPLPATDSAALP